MTRRGGRPGGSPRARNPAPGQGSPKRPHRARRHWWPPALGLAAVIAFGAIWWTRARVPDQPAPPTGPWTSLGPPAAYGAAIELMKKGQDLQSLPYLRHALAGTRGEIWEIPYAIFAALRNASFAVRERFDRTEPATRSSVERGRMVREALSYLTQAERVATHPRDIATIRKDRAELLLIWGFAWEAFVTYRDAQAADSTWDDAGLVADTLMNILERPAQGAD